jgi:hypothetical protein
MELASQPDSDYVSPEAVVDAQVAWEMYFDFNLHEPGDAKAFRMSNLEGAIVNVRKVLGWGIFEHHIDSHRALDPVMRIISHTTASYIGMEWVVEQIIKSLRDEGSVAYIAQGRAFRNRIRLLANSASIGLEISRDVHSVEYRMRSHHEAVHQLYDVNVGHAGTPSLEEVDDTAASIENISSLMTSMLASNQKQAQVVNSQQVSVEQGHRQVHEDLLRMVGYLESLAARWYVQGSPTRLWFDNFAFRNDLEVFRLASEM